MELQEWLESGSTMDILQGVFFGLFVGILGLIIFLIVGVLL